MTKPRSFEVCLPDRVVNTGLDLARFPTKKQAEEALQTVIAFFRDDDCAGASVRGTSDKANTTFKKWNEAGW